MWLLLHPRPAWRKAPGAPAFRENLFIYFFHPFNDRKNIGEKKVRNAKLVLRNNDLLIIDTATSNIKLCVCVLFYYLMFSTAVINFWHSDVL